jgi:hypothetical protein
MIRKYWFKPKTYGWGFVAISWEGRLMLLLLVLFILIAMIRNGLWLPLFPLTYDVNALQIISFVFDVTVLILGASWFMEKKCDGELKWRR